MGKVVVFKTADFSANMLEQLDIAVADPIIQIDVAGLVTITSDFEVRYTTDGSTPTTSSTLYGAPFTVAINTTVKAIAIGGGNTSEVVTAIYDGTVPAPSITISGGMATITSPYPCYYTLDGTTPTTSSTLYAAPFAVAEGDDIKAVAYANSTYSQVTEKVVAMMTFGKKLKSDGTLEDADSYCVSPFFEVGSKGDSITWNFNSPSPGASDWSYFCEFNVNKNNLGDGWNNGSIGNTTRTFSLYYNGVYYARATFKIGTPGTVVNNTTGETVFEYDGATS